MFRLALTALVGAAVASGAIAAAAWLQDLVIGAPPIDYPAFAFGAIALAAGWLMLTLTAPPKSD